MQNFPLSLTKATYEIKHCPLCNSKKTKFYKYFYKNRYTEEFSNLIGVEPSNLMRNISQRICIKCKLVFKRRWFKKKILSIIYNKVAPHHPNGWDIYSNKFSKQHFINLLNKLKKQNKSFKKNILKRSLISIIQSIDDKSTKIKKITKKFSDLIENDKDETIDFEKRKILKLITKPKKFSRFTGFNNYELFEFIVKKIGKLENYTEIGCPLWGMNKIAQEKMLKTFHIRPDYNFFWGKHCKKNSLKCETKLGNKTKFLNLDKIKKKYDYIGIYNYIDHINNLSNFLNLVFRKFKFVGIIQEDKVRGYPIQHNYGINNECMKFIAKRYEKKLIKNIKLFKNSKYNFYLFL